MGATASSSRRPTAGSMCSAFEAGGPEGRRRRLGRGPSAGRRLVPGPTPATSGNRAGRSGRPSGGGSWCRSTSHDRDARPTAAGAVVVAEVEPRCHRDRCGGPTDRPGRQRHRRVDDECHPTVGTADDGTPLLGYLARILSERTVELRTAPISIDDDSEEEGVPRVCVVVCAAWPALASWRHRRSQPTGNGSTRRSGTGPTGRPTSHALLSHQRIPTAPWPSSAAAAASSVFRSLRHGSTLIGACEAGVRVVNGRGRDARLLPDLCADPGSRAVARPIRART